MLMQEVTLGSEWAEFWTRVCFKNFAFLTLIQEKTLEENGVNDEDDEFEELGIRDDYYVPALHLMYNDDLTIG